MLAEVADGTGAPCGDGTPTTKPTSASMSRRTDGPYVGRVGVRRLALPARPHDVGARHDDGAGPAVVADRQVLPVGREGLAVRAGRSARRSRRGAGGVEVDVVGHLERQVQLHLGLRHQVALDQLAVALVLEQLDQPGPHRRPGRPAHRQERVERRRLEDVPAVEALGGGERSQVEHVVPERDARPGAPHRRARTRRRAGWSPGTASPRATSIQVRHQSTSRPRAGRGRRSSPSGSVDAAAAERPERGPYAGAGGLVPVPRRSPPADRRSRSASGTATSSTEPPVRATRVATSTLSTPCCSKPSAGRGPDGVVQPGRELERDTARRARHQEGGQLGLGRERRPA